MAINRTVHIVGSEIIYADERLSLRKDRLRIGAARTLDHLVVAVPRGCAVVPMTADDCVVLIRQYRHPLHGYFWEIPGGAILPTESPEECARRELREEAGYVAGAISPLIGTYHEMCSVAYCAMTIYKATDLRRASPSHGPDELIVEHGVFTKTAIADMIAKGQISAAFTITGLLMALQGMF